jgi:hypothetical protein
MWCRWLAEAEGRRVSRCWRAWVWSGRRWVSLSTAPREKPPPKGTSLLRPYILPSSSNLFPCLPPPQRLTIVLLCSNLIWSAWEARSESARASEQFTVINVMSCSYSSKISFCVPLEYFPDHGVSEQIPWSIALCERFFSCILGRSFPNHFHNIHSFILIILFIAVV